MLTALEPSRAFVNGNELWIVPHDSSSYWYQRLNWLTNFKLTDNELHMRPRLNPWLQKIIETCEIKTPEIPVAEPLLIPIGQWFPADWLIMLPYATDKEDQFIQKVQQVWEQFQRPPLRVFVPKTLLKERLEILWTKYKLTREATLVFEPE